MASENEPSTQQWHQPLGAVQKSADIFEILKHNVSMFQMRQR